MNVCEINDSNNEDDLYKNEYHDNLDFTGNLIKNGIETTLQRTIGDQSHQLQNSIDFAESTIKLIINNYSDSIISQLPFNFMIKIIIHNFTDVLLDSIKDQIVHIIQNFEYKFMRSITNEIYYIKNDIQILIFNFAKEKIFGTSHDNDRTSEFESKILSLFNCKDNYSESQQQISYLGLMSSNFE